MSPRAFAFGLVMVPFLFGCGDSNSTDSSASTGTTFTQAGIAKAWTSACTAGTEPIISGDHFKTTLTLGAGGTFSFVQYWYAGSSTCQAGSGIATYQGYGTYTLSDFNAGSTTTKTLSFTFDFVNYDTFLQSTGNATRTAFNNDCGGTSPYTGGTNSADGTSVHDKTMTCMHENFPNTGARKTFSNIGTFSGGVLTLGAYGDANIPGTFSGGSLPASATITFN